MSEQHLESNWLNLLTFARNGNALLGGLSIMIGAVVLLMVLGDNQHHSDKVMMCAMFLGGGFSLLTLSSVLWALEKLVRK